MVTNYTKKTNFGNLLFFILIGLFQWKVFMFIQHNAICWTLLWGPYMTHNVHWSVHSVPLLRFRQSPIKFNLKGRPKIKEKIVIICIRGIHYTPKFITPNFFTPTFFTSNFFPPKCFYTEIFYGEIFYADHFLRQYFVWQKMHFYAKTFFTPKNNCSCTKKFLY